MPTIKSLLCGFAATVLLISCQKADPSNDLTFQEQDVYITNRDQNADFSKVKTYVINEKVSPVLLTSNATTYKPTISDSLLMVLVNTNLSKRGFVKVDKSQNPDVAVIVSRLLFTATPGVYFDYINPATDGFTGLIKPDTFGLAKNTFTYSVPSNYTYVTIVNGSLSIDMVDLKPTGAEPKKLPIIWNGIVAGTLTNGLPGMEQREIDGVNSLFDQSPYLIAGN